MTIIQSAIDYMLVNEGMEYVNNPHDAGGPTKFGISSRFIKSLSDDEPLKSRDIKDWTLQDAYYVYEKYFWNNSACLKISNRRVAIKYFDTMVNLGKKEASLLLQRAVNFIFKDQKVLVEDGILGNESLKQINKLSAASLLTSYTVVLKDFYFYLVKKDPAQQVFLKGWIARAQRLPE
jgi:lysozyme family protein